jgi:hypothetical protein
VILKDFGYPDDYTGIKCLRMVLNHGVDVHELTISFPEDEQADHVYERIQAGKEIWFRQGHTQGVRYSRSNPSVLHILVYCKGVPGNELDEKDFVSVLEKILGRSASTGPTKGSAKGSGKDKSEEGQEAEREDARQRLAPLTAEEKAKVHPKSGIEKPTTQAEFKKMVIEPGALHRYMEKGGDPWRDFCKLPWDAPQAPSKSETGKSKGAELKGAGTTGAQSDQLAAAAASAARWQHVAAVLVRLGRRIIKAERTG